MKTHVAYCSARDQQVRVVKVDELPEEVRPSQHEKVGVICLANHKLCSGEMCPLFAAPTKKIQKWLDEHRGEEEFVVSP